MNRTRQIVEAGLFAAIMTLLMVGSYYIPFIGMVAFFVLPLPVIILTIRNTIVNTIVSTIIAAVITSSFVTIINGVSVGCLALFVGLPLGYCIRQKYNALKTIAIGGVGALIAFFVIIVVMQGVLGMSISEQLDEMFDFSGQMQTEMNSVLGGLNNESLNDSLAQSQAILENMKYAMKLLFPSAMILFSMVYSVINFLFSRSILKRLRISIQPIGAFEDFTYPKHVAFGGGLMIILALTVSYIGIGDPNLIIPNFLYLFLMVFSVQGLALLYFYLRRYMPKGLAVGVLVFISLSQLLYYISLVGFFDVIIQFRKRSTLKR